MMGEGPLYSSADESIARLSVTHVQLARVRRRMYHLAEKNGRDNHCVGTHIPGDGPCEFYDSDDIAVRIFRMEYSPELGAFAISRVSEGDFAPYIGDGRPFSGIQKKGDVVGLARARNPSPELRNI